MYLKEGRREITVSQLFTAQFRNFASKLPLLLFTPFVVKYKKIRAGVIFNRKRQENNEEVKMYSFRYVVQTKCYSFFFCFCSLYGKKKRVNTKPASGEERFLLCRKMKVYEDIILNSS